jgi:hypothetical protein
MFSKAGRGCSYLGYTVSATRTPYTTRTVSLDAGIARGEFPPPDVLFLDNEGQEQGAVEGLRRTLGSSRRPRVVLLAAYPYQHRRLNQFFNRIGYGSMAVEGVDPVPPCPIGQFDCAAENEFYKQRVYEFFNQQMGGVGFSPFPMLLRDMGKRPPPADSAAHKWRVPSARGGGVGAQGAGSKRSEAKPSVPFANPLVDLPPSKRDDSELFVVTCASADYFNNLLNLIGSGHVNSPGSKFVVYDLGLTPQQRAELSCLLDVTVRDFDVSEMPSHFRYI